MSAFISTSHFQSARDQKIRSVHRWTGRRLCCPITASLLLFLGFSSGAAPLSRIEPVQVDDHCLIPQPQPGTLEEIPFQPRELLFHQRGIASWYGPGFHGRCTANGETFDQNAMTAAHPSLPLGSMIRVTRITTGKEIVVRINDRGPYIDGRVLDLSQRAAAELEMVEKGLCPVKIDLLS